MVYFTINTIILAIDNRKRDIRNFYSYGHISGNSWVINIQHNWPFIIFKVYKRVNAILRTCNVPIALRELKIFLDILSWILAYYRMEYFIYSFCAIKKSVYIVICNVLLFSTCNCIVMLKNSHILFYFFIIKIIFKNTYSRLSNVEVNNK